MTVYTNINGKILDISDAQISVKDRGFRFGDGVFETIRVISGEMFRDDLHKARLSLGLDTLKINFDVESLFQDAVSLIDKNQLSEGFIRITISRGVGSRGYLPNLESGPTVVIETELPREIKKDNLSLWTDCNLQVSKNFAGVKTMQGLVYSLARMEAVENNCFDSVLLNSDGYICEASSANIFWIKGEEIFTPSVETGCVNGVMRQVVIEKLSEKINQGIFKMDDILNADAVFLTNVAGGIIPISQLMPSGKSLENNLVYELVRVN